MITCVAAGGSGSRMAPMTRWLNKHLAMLGRGKLMIDMPLHFIAAHGIKDVIIVTGSNHASQIVDYIRDGHEYGFTHVDYAFQPAPAGIADVLKRISHKDTTEGVLLILGDNYFSSIQHLLTMEFDSSMAIAFQYDVGTKKEAKRFGQVIFDDAGKPLDIVEKPGDPQHSSILTGLYYFPADVFKHIDALSPSGRGELEITDLLRMYLKENRLIVRNVVGQWFDLGEQETWSAFVSEFSAHRLPIPEMYEDHEQLLLET